MAADSLAVGDESGVEEIRAEVEDAAKVMLRINGIQRTDPAYSRRLYTAMNTRFNRLLRLPERWHDRDQIVSARQLHLQRGVPGHIWDTQPPPSHDALQPSASATAPRSPSDRTSMRPRAGNRPPPLPVAQNDMQPAPAHQASQQPPVQVASIARTPAPVGAAPYAGLQSTILGSYARPLTSNTSGAPMSKCLPMPYLRALS